MKPVGLADPRTVLWMASEDAPDGPLVGVARFALEGGEATVSVALAPERRGRGEGPALILRASHALFQTTDAASIHAWIKPENTASLSAFAKAGYRRVGAAEMRGQPAEHCVLARAEIPSHELLP